jgi:MFS family permease
MRIIFLGLAIWNTIFFVATLYLGETHSWPMHFTVALITAIFTCVTHSVVMIHFMGTGKGIKEAVETYSLPNDPQTGYVRRTKKFKGRTSGLATLAPFLIIITTWLGAAHHTGRMGVLWHAVLAYFSVVFNVYAFVVEYRVIKENSAMMNEINRLIAAKKAT